MTIQYIWPAKRQKESECRGGIGGEIKHSVVALKKNNHHTLFLLLLRLTKGLLPLSISRLCYCSANLASFVQKSDIHRHSQSLEWWPFSNLRYRLRVKKHQPEESLPCVCYSNWLSTVSRLQHTAGLATPVPLRASPHFHVLELFNNP